MQKQSKLITITKYLLYATALTPIIVTRSTLFPFVFGKIFFFRALIEIALILFCASKIVEYVQRRRNNKETSSEVTGIKQYNPFKHPLTIAVLAFFASWVVSAFFAVNAYRAFWGEIERGEGVFGVAHFVVFFLLAITLFHKKDWMRVFKVYIVSAFILAFYGFIQSVGIEDGIPFAFEKKERAEGFVGNSAFLAVHMLFVMAFAGLIMVRSKIKSAWWYVALAVIPVAFGTLLLTRTRGPFLGLGAGVVVMLAWLAIYGNRMQIRSDIWKKRIRGAAAVLIICGIIGGAVFWTTRMHPVWQKIPGFDRLAQTAAFDANDPSTQTRLILWGTAWDVFKERPIIGWGPENFLNGYLKHYNPDSSLYGETWFDRGHNKLLDVLAMHGIVGMALYIMLMGAVIHTARKTEWSTRLILYGLLTAHFIQNLVLFDQILSYITLATLFGYMIHLDYERKSAEGDHTPPAATRARYLPMWGAIALVTVVVLYEYTYIPYAQAQSFARARNGNQIELVMEEIKRAMTPYNYIQANMRGHIIEAYYESQPEIFEKPFFTALANQLILAMDDVLAREPYDPRNFIRVLKAINVQARTNESIYLISEDLSREALKQAPKRQELFYHLAFALAGQGKGDESVAVVREAIALSPKVARGHYHLALMLALSDIPSYQEEAQEELRIAVEELDPELRTIVGFDINNIAILYANWGRDDKVAELGLRTLRGESNKFSERRHYQTALRYVVGVQRADDIITIATHLMTYDDLEGDMEVLIDLVEKGKWNIIEKL